MNSKNTKHVDKTIATQYLLQIELIKLIGICKDSKTYMIPSVRKSLKLKYKGAQRELERLSMNRFVSNRKGYVVASKHACFHWLQTATNWYTSPESNAQFSSYHIQYLAKLTKCQTAITYLTSSK